MTFPAVVAIGIGVLGVIVLILFELAQILGEGGLKLLFWPRLNHGYEVAPVTRLSVAPWALLLFGLAANGACILLFGHDLLGHAEYRYVPWLAAALVPLALIHLIDYQRSVVAAALGFTLLTMGTLYMLHLYHAWVWLPLLLPFLLWSLNGVRAVHADRLFG
ncbi:MAG: hypothetical protein AB7I59_06785 [Geminicoccaceae bacterium]